MPVHYLPDNHKFDWLATIEWFNLNFIVVYWLWQSQGLQSVTPQVLTSLVVLQSKNVQLHSFFTFNVSASNHLMGEAHTERIPPTVASNFPSGLLLEFIQFRSCSMHWQSVTALMWPSSRHQWYLVENTPEMCSELLQMFLVLVLLLPL